MQIFETTSSLCQLSRVESQTGLCVGIVAIAYQMKSVDPRIFLGVLDDVAVWQPRTDDTEREQRLGYPEEGQYIWMRDTLPHYDLAVEPLRGTGLSQPFRRNGELVRTRLIFSRLAGVCVRNALMHTWLPSCWPFHISANPPDAYGMVSVNVTPGGKYDFGRVP